MSGHLANIQESCAPSLWKHSFEKVLKLLLFLVCTSETLTLVGKVLLTISGVISSEVSRKEATHSEYDFLFFSHQQDKGSVTGMRFEQLQFWGQSSVALGNSKPKELVCLQIREISMRCYEQHRLT